MCGAADKRNGLSAERSVDEGRTVSSGKRAICGRYGHVAKRIRFKPDLSQLLLNARTPTSSFAGFENNLAFRNPDGSLVIVAQNDTPAAHTVTFGIGGGKAFSASLSADPFNTFPVPLPRYGAISRGVMRKSTLSTGSLAERAIASL
jgi:hypothetical protein